MKRLFVVLLAMVMMLSACGQSTNTQEETLSWQEQYDLGVRYLSEGNYEEAIIAFAAAIEIDPKQPDTYEKLAEAYIALGDIDSAKDVLSQGVDATGEDYLRQRLDELLKSGSIMLSNNLDISNLYGYYVADHEIVEYNENAVGGVNLSFVVNGPSDVRRVYPIWYPFLPDYEQIDEDIANEVELWKQNELDGRIPPFDEGHAHPIWQEDLGETFYVVLVGLNENSDTVGYAVVQEIVGADGETGNVLDYQQEKSKSLLEENASANIIGIEDLTFCGNKITDIDFSTLTTTQCVSMMENAGFSECWERTEESSWSVGSSHSYNYGNEKHGQYTGFGNAGVRVDADFDCFYFRTSASSTYYGEEQLAIGIRNICIGNSFEEVLNGLGFDNATEISEKFHEVFIETESNGDDAVEETLDAMLQYDGDSFWYGDVWVKPDSWEMTLFMQNVENADFYTLTFHFGASGEAIKVYDESIQKYRNWSEYQDCLTWFEITVFK